MRLIERDAELPDFAVFHFGGHWFARGVEMAEMVGAAAGEQGLPIRRLPWWLVRLASPFVTTFREMLEMAYSGNSRCGWTTGVCWPSWAKSHTPRRWQPCGRACKGLAASARSPTHRLQMRRVPMQRVPTQRVPNARAANAQAAF